MNTKQAKSKHIIELLGRLGYEPAYKYANYHWYNSPVRNERKPSFFVNIERNLWYDVASSEGGNIIGLVMQLFSCGVSESLQHIGQIFGGNTFFSIQQNSSFKSVSTQSKKTPKITSVKDLENTSYGKYLVAYLDARRIPLKVAKPYLKNVSFRMNGKPYFALGWQNVNKGWEIRSKYLKTATSKAYSFISGTRQGSKGVNVFEGMIDFLTAIVHYGKAPSNDSIILNSTSLMAFVLPYVQCYNVVYSYLDNDRTGNRATNYLKDNHLNVKDMRHLYFSSFCPYTYFNDFNDWLCMKPCERSR